jgi:hypothetical protein
MTIVDSVLISWDLDFLEFNLFAAPLSQQGSQGHCLKLEGLFLVRWPRECIETCWEATTLVEVDQWFL